jgi:hypothetical protein
MLLLCLQMVSSEFRGGAASRLLRGSLVATLPGLSYQHTSAETLGQETVEGAGKEALNSSSWRGTTFSGAASVGACACLVSPYDNICDRLIILQHILCVVLRGVCM